jgi:hypothetical protein
MRRTLLVCLVLSTPALLCAQTPSLGPEFPVNTYTTFAQESAAVASRGDGSFVVVWHSSTQDGSYVGVFGQRFDSAGAPAGSEFQVNTYTTGHQFSPQIGCDAAGNFVVVWHSQPVSVGSGPDDIFGQRFDASGGKVGAEFRVNTYTTGSQSRPALAVGSAGSFVVVWTSDNQASGLDVFGQRFNASGSKVGPEFLVNTYTSDTQYSPQVALGRSGDFAVVWTSVGQDGSVTGIFGQRFDAAGVKRGPEFQVNSYTTGTQGQPRVAVDRGGNFIVVWHSDTPDQSFGIFGQRFDASGAKVGPEFAVNAYTPNGQYNPSLAVDSRGNFVVAWHGDVLDGSGDGIAGRHFDRAGRALGSQFPINVYRSSDQIAPALADTGRGFVAAWTNTSDQDGSGAGIFGRRERLAPEGLMVDAHGIGTSDLNGVLEPGDAAIVEPVWRNAGGDLAGLDGTASNFTGPAGPNYAMFDALANYVPVLTGSTTNCNDGNPNPCYALQVSGARPATHWDAQLQEDLGIGGTQVWTLHVGDSFSDVPRSQPFYKKIETLLHNGITTGCNATQYCPGLPVSRDQMGIFIAKGIAGLGELVPVSGLVSGAAYNCSAGGHSLFTDVSPTASFCRHVHYLASQNVTLGCSAAAYCPSLTVTRDAMASFIAKAVVAPGGGNAVPLAYGPDPATGLSYSCAPGSPNLHFTDVPASNAFCKHIHYLWAKGIVGGCTATQYCPTQTVNRDAMAKFIANGFGLQLYGP